MTSDIGLSALQTKQSIHCPNCGSAAERIFITSRQVVQTQCPICDYLMITCAQTCRVIEAYAPGISTRSNFLR